MSKTLIFFLDITSSAFVKAIVCISHFIYMGTFALTNCKDNLYFAKLQNFSAKFAISILHFILFTQTQNYQVAFFTNINRFRDKISSFICLQNDNQASLQADFLIFFPTHSLAT